MELQDVLALLEKSATYRDWRTHNPNAFLAHAFVMLDEPNKNTWQIGYFDEPGNTMCTFIVTGQNVDVIPDQEVLKAEQRIRALNPAEVTVPVAEALAIAQKTKLQHYPREQAVKTFFIIQNLEEHGSVFNITYFTATFKTINIKCSTKNGAVVHHTIKALAAFG